MARKIHEMSCMKGVKRTAGTPSTPVKRYCRRVKGGSRQGHPRLKLYYRTITPPCADHPSGTAVAFHSEEMRLQHRSQPPCDARSRQMTSIVSDNQQELSDILASCMAPIRVFVNNKRARDRTRHRLATPTNRQTSISCRNGRSGDATVVLLS